MFVKFPRDIDQNVLTEMLFWCRDRLGYPHQDKWGYHRGLGPEDSAEKWIFWFTKEEDAIHFKLVWA